MKKETTHEVTDRIILISDKYVSFYLIKTRGGYIAIDAGTNCKNALREMKRWQIDPGSILAVFLTHTDTDHTAALAGFPRAEVFLSKDEEQMINGTTRRFLFTRNKKIGEYTLLADGEEKQIGDLKLRALLTPGHTPGSTSYLLEDKYLFTGDTLSLKEGKAALFAPFIGMNKADQERSLCRLANLPDIAYILTAHSGYTRDAEKAFASWL